MNNYNKQPEYWREIDAAQFSFFFFQYILKPAESRQIHYNSNGNNVEYLGSVRLWETTYQEWEGIGVAMAWDKGEMRYFEYGDPDRIRGLQCKFAAQFAGDNS